MNELSCLYGSEWYEACEDERVCWRDISSKIYSPFLRGSGAIRFLFFCNFAGRECTGNVPNLFSEPLKIPKMYHRKSVPFGCHYYIRFLHLIQQIWSTFRNKLFFFLTSFYHLFSSFDDCGCCALPPDLRVVCLNQAWLFLISAWFIEKRRVFTHKNGNFIFVLPWNMAIYV